MIKVTFSFDTPEQAAEFLLRGVKAPEVTFTASDSSVPVEQPAPAAPKARKPRSDAGQKREPYGPRTPKAEETPAPAAAEPVEAAPAAAPASAEITIDTLKAAMSQLAKVKNLEANIAALAKFGVRRVSELSRENYADFLAHVKKEAGVK